MMRTIRRDLSKMREACRQSNTSFLAAFFKTAKYHVLYGKKIVAHKNAIIKGIANIVSDYTLTIGLGTTGFVHDKDVTFLNIRGKLFLAGNYSIGRGCRIDIAEGGEMRIGKGGYTNVNTTFIVANRLTIGDDCIISWNCQFLDDDFHEIEYEGKTAKRNEILIGNNVWIGCGAEIYKGTAIPNGCVIAARSVVRGIFTEENCLIAGNPAKVVKRNITWQ